MSAGDSGSTEPYPRGLGDSHPTPPAPAGGAPGEPLPSLPPSDEVVIRRRRRRWPWVIAVAIVVVAGLAVAGELVARSLVADSVRGQVIAALDLPKDQQLQVGTEGLVLPQLIAGRLDVLDVSSEEIALGPLVGAASVHAVGVPVRGGGTAQASGTVRVTAGQFTELAKESGLPIEEIALSAPDLTAKGEVSLLGAKVPLSVQVTPGAEDGDVTLTPVSATIGSVTLKADEIESRFGSLAKGLTGTQRVCIADQLPAGLRLVSLAVSGDVIVAGIEGAIASDSTQREKGTCPSR
ncbi:hypothetical protein J2Y69_001031 [Microbacterium resistens]|uniref:DUF2993 domain-containing protein n=1 Tax=Microbacterium resistens TaxID=156977 RepID=A0ABU1S9Z7_9MICO|nr:LmeA family phospholipid-binding protein [Microbacterium resistens]MDR6866439.1 hypothetical protein [Microbacterium resistens]